MAPQSVIEGLLITDNRRVANKCASFRKALSISFLIALVRNGERYRAVQSFVKEVPKERARFALFLRCKTGNDGE